MPLKPMTRICEICHAPYESWSRNSRYCDLCRVTKDDWYGLSVRIRAKCAVLNKQIQEAMMARCKVWTCQEYSQEFLANLIPRR